ncbi:unnamed protein product (mitochondrion) [Plasmodiophora brassicae]|uniref:Uncharacterized protein n=1 Tax=Plasmodiophora brassicae TaxID=37360 RepID=A0A0G4IYZ4_PLABS|nr:hypothetical protein PBRA_008063 [Plasmodiophora brassicae]SPQ95107.1 unnamed protein product [Plasmodiophora brassicae]
MNRIRISVTSPEMVETLIATMEGVVPAKAVDEGRPVKLKAIQRVDPVKSASAGGECTSPSSPKRAAKKKASKVAKDHDGDTDSNSSEEKKAIAAWGLKPSKFRPAYTMSSDDDSNASDDITVDGDEEAAAELLQTWDNGSVFSQSDDEKMENE